MFWNSGEKDKESEDLKHAAAKPEPQKNAPLFSTDKDPRSAIGKGTTIQGRLTFDTAVRIDGTLKGEVFSLSEIVVGEHGLIEAQLEADVLRIYGSFKGKAHVRKILFLAPGSRFEGELQLDSMGLSISEGAHFSAQCVMSVASGALADIQQKGQVAGPKAIDSKKTGLHRDSPQAEHQPARVQ